MTLRAVLSPTRLLLMLALAVGVALAPNGVQTSDQLVPISDTDGSGGDGSGSVKKIAKFSRAERQMMRYIDRARDRRGIHDMNRSRAIGYKARLHAKRMRSDGSIFHSELGSMLKSLSWQIAGENVGMGPDLKGLHKAFMKSPGHKHNLLDKRFNRFAVGIVKDNGYIYVTVMFLG